jgi:hypothetical protein
LRSVSHNSIYPIAVECLLKVEDDYGSLQAEQKKPKTKEKEKLEQISLKNGGVKRANRFFSHVMSKISVPFILIVIFFEL